jgi:polyhydroxybutyrate depolymerase
MLRSLPAVLLLFAGTSLIAQPDTIHVGGRDRTYTVRLPSSYTGTTPMPLVVAMHGGFGSGTQLENQSQLTVKAEEAGFIVVYPDGVASLLGIRTWNAGGCCGYAMNQDIDDVGFINALLDTLIADYAIDTQRIYATGMSNGGFMSYRLACELANRIAAIAPVSASMTIAACQPVRPVPVISFHSYQDTSVPYQGGVGDGISNHYNSPQDSVLNAFAAHAGCTVLNDTLQHDNVMTVIRWHECACNAEVITYRTPDGGHSWHGGNGTGIGDPPSTAVSANDLMWELFQQHTLNCSTTGIGASIGDLPLRVVPNPAHAWIEVQGEGITWVRVLDPIGRVVHAGRPGRIDLAGRAPGLYLVQAIDRQGGPRTARFVRE